MTRGICAVDGCTSLARVAGKCKRHYQKPVTPATTCPECGFTTVPNALPAHVRMHDRDASARRFWSYVDRRGPDECWEWQGGRDSKGYGNAQWDGRTDKAHRVAWRLTHGPVPEGLHVRHVVCDNPPCCNPSHLAPGTHTENMADRDGKGRQASGDRSGMRRHPEAIQHGSEKHGAKLTEADIPVIRQLLAEGMSHRLIAQRYGVYKATISAIASGRKWRHVQ